MDIFGKEPNPLSFGGSKHDKSKGNMYLTSLGGFTTVMFYVIFGMYLLSAFIALHAGESDMVEDTTQESLLIGDSALSLAAMKVMPVITVNYMNQHIYVNTTLSAFKRNIFVGLLQEKLDTDGSKIAEFEEFVPCSEVKD